MLKIDNASSTVANICKENINMIHTKMYSLYIAIHKKLHIMNKKFIEFQKF